VGRGQAVYAGGVGAVIREGKKLKEKMRRMDGNNRKWCERNGDGKKRNG
jgi:hypothetical protein